MSQFLVGTHFSADRCYRYSLERDLTEGRDSLWGDDLKPRRACMFLMLNPSTADENTNDPTLRRCLGYARKWGYSNLLVGNLFAYCSTDPEELEVCSLFSLGPDGPDNLTWLGRMTEAAEIVVCAWGNSPLTVPVPVADLLDLHRSKLRRLVLTRAGNPGHPLRLRRGLQPVAWP